MQERIAARVGSREFERTMQAGLIDGSHFTTMDPFQSVAKWCRLAQTHYADLSKVFFFRPRCQNACAGDVLIPIVFWPCVDWQ